MLMPLDELEKAFEEYKTYTEETPEILVRTRRDALVEAIPDLIFRIRKLDKVLDYVARLASDSQNCLICPADKICGALGWKRSKDECKILLRVALEKKSDF